MNTQLKAKFLQQFSQKEQGFTLIELLVVIIIIGILSAIALPSFLSQANKAKQSEAKQYVGSLNRSQQAYYLENSRFASSLEELANVIPSSTANYLYIIEAPAAGATDSVVSFGTAQKETSSLKSYAGGVFVQVVGEASDSSTSAVLCESKTATTANLTPPTGQAGKTQCEGDSIRL